MHRFATEVHRLFPSVRLTDPEGHFSHSGMPWLPPLLPAGHAWQSAMAVPPRKFRKVPTGHASRAAVLLSLQVLLSELSQMSNDEAFHGILYINFATLS